MRKTINRNVSKTWDPEAVHTPRRVIPTEDIIVHLVPRKHFFMIFYEFWNTTTPIWWASELINILSIFYAQLCLGNVTLLRCRIVFISYLFHYVKRRLYGRKGTTYTHICVIKKIWLHITCLSKLHFDLMYIS